MSFLDRIIKMLQRVNESSIARRSKRKERKISREQKRFRKNAPENISRGNLISSKGSGKTSGRRKAKRKAALKRVLQIRKEIKENKKISLEKIKDIKKQSKSQYDKIKRKIKAHYKEKLRHDGKIRDNIKYLSSEKAKMIDQLREQKRAINFYTILTDKLVSAAKDELGNGFFYDKFKSSAVLQFKETMTTLLSKYILGQITRDELKSEFYRAKRELEENIGFELERIDFKEISSKGVAARQK